MDSTGAWEEGERDSMAQRDSLELDRSRMMEDTAGTENMESTLVAHRDRPGTEGMEDIDVLLQHSIEQVAAHQAPEAGTDKDMVAAAVAAAAVVEHMAAVVYKHLVLGLAAAAVAVVVVVVVVVIAIPGLIVVVIA